MAFKIYIDIEYICGLEADIKIRVTYHIVGQPFCKVIKMILSGLGAGILYAFF